MKINIEKITGMKLYSDQKKIILDLLKDKELKSNDINSKARAGFAVGSNKISK